MFDTHVHLNSPKMNDNIDEYINLAHENGVQYMVVVGYDYESSKEAIRIANQYQDIYAAVGFHPTDSFNLQEEDYKRIEALVQNEKVVAIGEIGLDYYWDNVPKDQQHESFRRQLRMAKKYNLPVIIHTREAMKDTIDIIKDEDIHDGVFHCYSGSYETSLEVIKQGFYISLAGPVTFKNAAKPKEVASKVPLDRLLVETDSPYLAPQAHRGQMNQPAFVKFVVEEVAGLRNQDVELIAKQTQENGLRLFKIGG